MKSQQHDNTVSHQGSTDVSKKSSGTNLQGIATLDAIIGIFKSFPFISTNLAVVRRAIVRQDQVHVALWLKLLRVKLCTVQFQAIVLTLLCSATITVSKMRVSAASGSLRYIVRNFAITLKIWDPLGHYTEQLQKINWLLFVNCFTDSKSHISGLYYCC